MFLFFVLSFSKKGDTIQGWTLFKGGHYLRKYSTQNIRRYQFKLHSQQCCRNVKKHWVCQYIVIGGDCVPSTVEIGLIDLPNIAPPPVSGITAYHPNLTPFVIIKWYNVSKKNAKMCQAHRKQSMSYAKGQLISKCLFSVSNSPKK